MIRSTGVGAAAGFGRAGALVSAYVGSTSLNLGSGAFFGVIAACAAVTFAAVAILNRHAAPLRSQSQQPRKKTLGEAPGARIQ
jgi:MFS transporter, AAHS family, 4-hydroxybenzoate transporter